MIKNYIVICPHMNNRQNSGPPIQYLSQYLFIPLFYVDIAINDQSLRDLSNQNAFFLVVHISFNDRNDHYIKYHCCIISVTASYNHIHMNFSKSLRKNFIETLGTHLHVCG